MIKRSVLTLLSIATLTQTVAAGPFRTLIVNTNDSNAVSDSTRTNSYPALRFKNTVTFGTNDANNATIDSAGFLELNGTAKTWDDLRFPISAVRLGIDKPPVLTAYKGSVVLAFEDQGAAANEQRITFIVQIPHTYAEGTAVYPHVHWVPEDATAGNVRWQLTHSWTNIAGIFPTEASIVTNAPAPAVADKHTRSPLGTIDGTGKTISSIIVCTLRRNSSNAGDTFTGKDAYLLEIDFHYQVDSLGSRFEYDSK